MLRRSSSSRLFFQKILVQTIAQLPHRVSYDIVFSRMVARMPPEDVYTDLVFAYLACLLLPVFSRSHT